MSEPAKAAAHEAAQKYAQNKCLTLVSSASTLAVEANGNKPHSQTPSPTPGNSERFASPSHQKKLPSSGQDAGSESDCGEDTPFDETTDFGIDKNIARAALTALGPDGMFLSATGDISKTSKPGSRKKKNFSEMDEDERLLASEDAKKLTSRQRRQLRNRVSARHFRLRRKEYISHLESLVVNMTAKINKLDRALNECQEEGKRLKHALDHGQNPLASQVSNNMTRDTSNMEIYQHAGLTQSAGLLPVKTQTGHNFIPNFVLPNQQQMPMSQEQFHHQSLLPIAPTHYNIPSPDGISHNSSALFSGLKNSTLADDIPAANFRQQILPSPASSSPSSTSTSAVQQVMGTSRPPQTTPRNETADAIRMKPNVVNLLPMYPDVSPMPISTQPYALDVQSTGLYNTFDMNGMGTQVDYANFSIDNNQMWNPDGGMMEGLIQVPNTQIYRSMLPSLEEQLAKSESSKKSNKIPDAQSGSNPSKLDLSDSSTPRTVFEKDLPKKEASEKDGPDKDSSGLDTFEGIAASNVTDKVISLATGEDAKLSNLVADAVLKRLDLQMSRLKV